MQNISSDSEQKAKEIAKSWLSIWMQLLAELEILAGKTAFVKGLAEGLAYQKFVYIQF